MSDSYYFVATVDHVEPGTAHDVLHLIERSCGTTVWEVYATSADSSRMRFTFVEQVSSRLELGALGAEVATDIQEALTASSSCAEITGVTVEHWTGVGPRTSRPHARRLQQLELEHLADRLEDLEHLRAAMATIDPADQGRGQR